ncbi:hypothetical protein ACWEOO_21335 [Kribbella sp. NPDC004138]
MRLRVRDILAVVLLLAVLVPYVGYLVDSDVPLIDDPRAMASTGLFLGGLAFWVIRGGQRTTRLGRVEAGAAGLALVLYVLTIALAATGGVELLLAAFMCSLLLVLALDLLDRGSPRHDAVVRR